jgi:hypothetical protein
LLTEHRLSLLIALRVVPNLIRADRISSTDGTLVCLPGGIDTAGQILLLRLFEITVWIFKTLGIVVIVAISWRPFRRVCSGSVTVQIRRLIAVLTGIRGRRVTAAKSIAPKAIAAKSVVAKSIAAKPVATTAIVTKISVVSGIVATLISAILAAIVGIVAVRWASPRFIAQRLAATTIGALAAKILSLMKVVELMLLRIGRSETAVLLLMKAAKAVVATAKMSART